MSDRGDLVANLPLELRGRIRPGKAAFIEPMRATLTYDHFSDPEWIYERKLDGERILAVRKGGRVTLFTRNRKSASAPYPELVAALKEMEVAGDRDADFVLDGEVVAFDENGQTSFPLLQRRMLKTDSRASVATGVAVHYVVFDVLVVGTHDVTRLPLLARKEILRDQFDLQDPVRYLDHRVEEGEEFLEEACASRWEGLIAKRADASYQTRRSKDWLKFKCVTGQEFVIAGYTEPKGSRTGFGALLLGYHDDGSLRYAGKVGTGFTDRALRDLLRTMEGLEQEETPFDEPVPEAGAHWVRPKLVCEVEFTEWTEDGRLRHPRFKGLRRDKKPSQIRREEPAVNA